MGSGLVGSKSRPSRFMRDLAEWNETANHFLTIL
jgi:hypothetical protein